MLRPAQYALVSNTPYKMSAHPSALTLQRNIDAAEAVCRREAHQESIRKFREAGAIKKALIRQIVAAIVRWTVH